MWGQPPSAVQSSEARQGLVVTGRWVDSMLGGGVSDESPRLR